MIRVCTLQFGERAYFAESKRFGEDYCARHGYSWHVLTGVEFTDGRDLRWSKVPGVAGVLALPDTDLVFYIDADAVVSRPEQSLDLPIALLGGSDLLIGVDRMGRLNTGVWLAKPSAIDILQCWDKTPSLDPTLCHRWPVDEAGFIEHVEPQYQRRIKVVSRSELNLVDGFVHHQMAGTQHMKQRIMAARRK